MAETLCRKNGGGRVAALVVLITNSAVSNLIRESKTFQNPSIMQVSRGAEMLMPNDALAELVKTKQIESKEAYLKSIDKTEMNNQLRLRRLGTELSFIMKSPTGT